MAHKTTSKLALRKETLRQLNHNQLARVAGGLISSNICLADQNTRFTNSTDPHPIFDENTRIIGWAG
jgi:hypothetical protein